MNNTKYSQVARALHWVIAGLIVGQYILAELAEYADETGKVVSQLAILANHKSVGITILLLAVVRVLWRVTHTPPALPVSMPSWQHRISNFAHLLLYTFLFALPISGWLMSSAKSYSVSWFGLVVLPDLVGPSEALAAQLVNIHELLAEALFVIAVIHIAAALKHYWLDKDGVMQRMAGWGGLLTFIVLVGVVALGFGRVGVPSSAELPNSQPSAAVTAPLEPSSVTKSSLPVWAIDYPNSVIKFTGDQAGAPFEGQWQQWQADIQFDSTSLNQSRFDVRIDVASVASGDAERDGYIVGEDFFDASEFAHASFVADNFVATDDGYTASGQLSMKGITQTTEFHFKVTSDGNTQVLNGSAKLDRLAWNIGAGDWADTSWVGQFVDVQVNVTTEEK